MPWTVKDVDEHKKGLTPSQKREWVRVANETLNDCLKAGGSQKICEGKAIRIANSKFSEETMEWTDEQWKAHDEYFGLADDKKKPGGSNVGKYKKGPFCGPAGGAPKGSYPVDTKKRAIAAIAYARHAPNPAGIKKCVCRHWPSLPACKKKEKQSMSQETQKIPKAALCFMDHECFAQVKAKDGEDQLTMVVYSGGIIKGHWYWNNLAIDLTGVSFPKAKYPVLENHDSSRKIAFSKKPKIDSGAIVIDTAEFVDTPESEEFRKLSKQGFPYEASMYAKPTVIERVAEGAKVDVNDMSVKGPATVWRKCIFKEASACVFGWDSNTRATAFADEEVELTVETVENLSIKEVNQMTLAELRQEHPELFVEFQAEIETDLRAEFDKEKTAMEAKFEQEKTKFAQEKADLEKDLSTKLSERDERVLKLEKKDIIRTENERQDTADRIWSEKLADSDIDPGIHDKVRAHVTFSQFIKDDVFDTEAFTAAVEAEIRDWESKLPKPSSVIGGGFGQKEVVDDPKLAAQDAEDEKLADDIFEASGGKREEVK